MKSHLAIERNENRSFLCCPGVLSMCLDAQFAANRGQKVSLDGAGKRVLSTISGQSSTEPPR